MAETQNAPPATVEVNDAIFCTHFKEVVRSNPHKITIFPLSTLLIAYSVLIVSSMVEKRMIRSLG
jgi:hypothetical protein